MSIGQSKECCPTNPFYADKEKLPVVIKHDYWWGVNTPWPCQAIVVTYFMSYAPVFNNMIKCLIFSLCSVCKATYFLALAGFPSEPIKFALLSYFIYFITAAFQYILHILSILNISRGTAFKLTDTSRTSLLCNYTFMFQESLPLAFNCTSNQLLISHLVNLKSSFSLPLQCGLL